MSVQSEINRIKALKTRIATKLKDLGLATGTETLADLTVIIEGIEDLGDGDKELEYGEELDFSGGGYYRGGKIMAPMGTFYATYGTTSYNDIKTKYDKGVNVVCKKSEKFFQLTQLSASGAIFCRVGDTADSMELAIVSGSSWSEKTLSFGNTKLELTYDDDTSEDVEVATITKT